ncbi:WRC [Musa troglodytarum]|uniref:WRC n=1 Tax=Musa troglodytarum TaxID=320322 RepID=A0A9E7JFH3_9LILI|nr:WRC [Musa troglodytarum]
MRIRKCASRLLGTRRAGSPSPLTAGLNSSPPPQTLSWDSEASSSSAAAGLLCQLNQSPWDDPMCLELIAACDPEEEEDDGGILGNGVKAEVGEPRGNPGNRIKYDAAAVSCVLKRRESTEEGRGKDDEEEERQCPPNKRRSCGYGGFSELQEERRQSPGHGKAAESPPSECQGGVSRRQKKTDTAGADSNMYYYYAGFGPWRAKTRSRQGTDDDEEEEEQEDGQEILESGNGCDVDAPATAGEDENSDEDKGDNSGRDREGSKRSHRKRGRKRMKARSLKSLL